MGVDKVGRETTSPGCAIPVHSPAAALAPLCLAEGTVQWGLLLLSENPYEPDASFLKGAVVADAVLGGQEKPGDMFASFNVWGMDGVSE